MTTGEDTHGPDYFTSLFLLPQLCNSTLEGDPGRLKRILGLKGAFKNRTSAYRTLKGMEAMRSWKKGQGTMFAFGHLNPDAVIVSRVFERA